LIVWLTSGVVILTLITGIALYEYMDEALERQLDAALAAKAGEIAHAVHIEEDGKPHLRMPTDAAFTNPHPHHEGQFYYEILTMQGQLVDRFVPPDQGATRLPHITKPQRRYADARLLDGTPIRLTQIVFTPQGDEDEPPRPVDANAAPLLLIVAHDTESMDIPLAVLLSGLLLCAALQIVALIAIVAVSVRRGLRPLTTMSALVDRVGSESLDLRIENTPGLPAELQPIRAKLNDLLDRLSFAFARERRFSAAVAHELRTPLAELQSACDVALRWPDDAGTLTSALVDAREVAQQMTTMVQSLLQLARARTGDTLLLEKQDVPLRDAITNAYPQFLEAAEARSQTVSIDIPENARVRINRDLLFAILRNLLSNAIEYTPRQGSIKIRFMPSEAAGSTLEIENTCQGLNEDDVPHLAEPFWRKDPSRTGYHTGLGLTLVQHYCAVCALQLQLQIPTVDLISIAICFPGEDCDSASLAAIHPASTA
jgi:two-component system sensor histidine kinase QseC